MYEIPFAVDGPELLYVTLLFTVLPATEVGGTDTVVVTSAIGEIAVVPSAESGCALAP